MVRSISIALIFSFLLQNTSQLWIIVQFIIERDYIAANLCEKRMDSTSSCQGKCYLKKTLKESEKNQSKQLPVLKEKELELFSQNNRNFSIVPEIRLISKAPHVTFSNRKLVGFTSSVFHPPC